MTWCITSRTAAELVGARRAAADEHFIVSLLGAALAMVFLLAPSLWVRTITNPADAQFVGSWQGRVLSSRPHARKVDPDPRPSAHELVKLVLQGAIFHGGHRRRRVVAFSPQRQRWRRGGGSEARCCQPDEGNGDEQK